MKKVNALATIGHVGTGKTTLLTQSLRDKGVIIVDEPQSKITISDVEKKFNSIFIEPMFPVVIPIGYKKRPTLADRLRDIKITDYQTLCSEYLLITEKKSGLSANNRNLITLLYKGL